MLNALFFNCIKDSSEPLYSLSLLSKEIVFSLIQLKLGLTELCKSYYLNLCKIFVILPYDFYYIR
jgi:hypothetical protein